MSLIVTSTGWWGIPGRTPYGRSPVVHAVHESKPICGQKIDHRAEYQWCAYGLQWDYLDCDKCKQILSAEARNEALWQKDSATVWKRTDGAYVTYNTRLMGPETNIILPGHRGWVAYLPLKRGVRTYLGYYPRRRRRAGHSWMHVARKFKSAKSAMRTLDRESPYEKPHR
jgi:hypothetical protein